MKFIPTTPSLSNTALNKILSLPYSLQAISQSKLFKTVILRRMSQAMTSLISYHSSIIYIYATKDIQIKTSETSISLESMFASSFPQSAI